MVEVTVTRRWLNAVHGEMSHEQQQRWSFAAEVYCPKCGQLKVWAEETARYDEDNAGECHLCAACGHSFHYAGLGNYINEAEAAQILVAVRAI